MTLNLTQTLSNTAGNTLTFEPNNMHLSLFILCFPILLACLILVINAVRE